MAARRIAPQYPHAAWLKDGNLLVHTKTGKGVLAPDGRPIVPPTFHRIGERGEVYEAMHEDLTRSLFTTDGRAVGSLRVADDGVAKEGLVPVRHVANGPWGYVDLEGNEVIAPRFALAGPFGEGRAIARDERGLLVIDRSGAELARVSLDPNARDVSGFGRSGLAWVDYGRIALVASDGRVVIGPYLAQVYGLDAAAVWIKYATND